MFTALLTTFAAGVAAQEGGKTLNVEDVAGKTFIYLDGAWGNYSMYLRKDGTFKVCAGPKQGCDEGTWSLDGDGKLVRVYQTWYPGAAHRPKLIALTVNGKEGTFAGIQAKVLSLDDKFPLSPIYDDPRK